MYKIRLPNFEGPFDLLLYFIKRDELNIYDIPISKITMEFLKYIRVIQYFDLELAGEFILMASTLMYIKTQMLLPRKVSEDGSIVDDPRTQLVQRILEYKQFKEASRDLSSMAEEQRYTYYKEIFDAEYAQAEGGLIFKNATLFDLLKAFKTALDRNSVETPEHVVEIFKVSVDDKIELINSKLNKYPSVSFLSLVSGLNRQHIVVTFLAILEMIKLQQIFIHQEDNFDDIIIANKPILEEDSVINQDNE